MPRDTRSAEAQAYRHLYDLAAWRGPHGARAQQLSKQPLCERCLAAGIITAATVVNHRKPHRGDMRLFLDPANHESTCKSHHDADIQSEERRGFSTAIGPDGWPTDPMHPANRRPTFEDSGTAYDPDARGYELQGRRTKP